MSNEFFKTNYKLENLAASILQIQFTQLAIQLVARYRRLYGVCTLYYRVHNGLKSCLKEYSNFHYALVFLRAIS